jgi:hypothetical protein
MTSKRGFERGEGRLGLIVALLVVGVVAYAAYVIIPVKVMTYEFQDELEQEARFAALNKKDDIVHQRLLKKAKQLGIRLDPDELTISREGGSMLITARYAVPLDFSVYQTEWTYEQRGTAPIF